MNKHIIILLSISALIVIFTGCDTDGKKFFEDERYIKQIYTVSDGNNIFHSEYDMNIEGDFSSRNLSYAVSGTNPIDDDVTIEIEEKPELVDSYNESTYMDETDKYAIKLSDTDYEIPSKKIIIEAGKNPNSEYGLLNIRIKKEKLVSLSPDSTYFIAVGIKSTSPYPVIEEKRNVLYRIYKKNDYATMKKSSFYTSNGYEGDAYFSGIQKQVHPLTDKATRFTVGNLLYSANDTEEQIKKKSMVIVVNDDKTVDLLAYKDGLIIEKLIPSDDPTEASYYFRNEYNEENKSFSLYYRYSVNGGVTFSKDIKETLTRDTSE